MPERDIEPREYDFAPEEPSAIGMRLAYEGAIVVQTEEGSWICQHDNGRTQAGTPQACARKCLTHCEKGD